MKRWIILCSLLLLVLLPSMDIPFRSHNPTIRIGIQSPLSGEQAAQGEAVRMGAFMAVLESQAEFTKKFGINLSALPKDDNKNTNKGVKNAFRLCEDQETMGVVGHLNSNVALAALNVYEKCKLPLVSPANTSNELTELGFHTFFRVPPSDNEQGKALASEAFYHHGAKRVAVMHDNTSSGLGLAAAFRESFLALGGQVTSYDGITSGEQDFKGPVNSVLQSFGGNTQDRPAVMFGGSYPDFCNLYPQFREKGFKNTFFTTDGVASPEFAKCIKKTGKPLYEVYYSAIASDITKTPKGSVWARDFKNRFGLDHEEVTYNAYIAAKTLIQVARDMLNHKIDEGGRPTNSPSLAAKAFLPEGAWNREVTLRALRNYKDEGVHFDTLGNNQSARVFVHKFEEATYPGKLFREYDNQGRAVASGTDTIQAVANPPLATTTQETTTNNKRKKS